MTGAIGKNISFGQTPKYIQACLRTDIRVLNSLGSRSSQMAIVLFFHMETIEINAANALEMAGDYTMCKRRSG